MNGMIRITARESAAIACLFYGHNDKLTDRLKNKHSLYIFRVLYTCSELPAYFL